MTAAILPFTKSSERDFSAICGRGAVVRVRGWTGAMAQLTGSPARIVVGRYANDNRLIVSQAPLAGEAGAYCCRLTGLFSIRGASVEFLNFCRPFGRPATLLRALLNSVQEPSRRVVQAFKSFRGGWGLLRHVSKHDSGVTQDVGTIDQRRGFFSQGVGCV